MSELPQGWEETSLINIGLPQTPNVDPSKYPNEVFELYSVPSYNDGKPEILSANEIKSVKQAVEPGDVLLCKIVPHINRVWRVRERGLYRQIASGEWIVIRAKNIDENYIRYALTEPNFRNSFMETVSGVGGSLMRARPKLVANLSILIPVKEDEQRRIVAKLDSVLGSSSRARQELAHVPRLVERYKQAILTKAFNGELTADWRTKNKDVEPTTALVARTKTPIQSRGGRAGTERVIPGIAALSINHPGSSAPKGWMWVPLNQIARQETGHTPSRTHPEWWEGDIPWLGIKDANAHHGGFIYNTFQHINAEGLANSSARLLPANTVCLSRTASIGYAVIIGNDMATSQDFVTWTCTDALMPKFLLYALIAEGDEIRRFGKGSTHTTIYFPEIRALHICLAPIKEQQEIVRLIETAFAHIDQMEAEAQAAARLLDRFEQMALAKAFRGELVTAGDGN